MKRNNKKLDPKDPRYMTKEQEQIVNLILSNNELKSGNMTCTYSNNTENINYNYELSFKYKKNRLNSSRMTTTSRLSDTATDNSFLKEKNNSC